MREMSSPPEPTRGARSRTTRLALIAVPVVVLLLLVAGVAFSLLPEVERLRVPADGMEPTLREGSSFDLNNAAYDGKAPARNDIVVLYAPAGARCGASIGPNDLCPAPADRRSEDRYVQRIVAGPGDRVRIRGGRAIVNGEGLEEPYASCAGGGVGGCDLRKEVTVPDDHWFTLGDNRGSSIDSRFFGPVPTEWLVGRVEDCELAGLRCSPRR